MAKIKITRDQLKFLIPLVLPYARQLAERTETTLDDRAVDAVQHAINNPVVFDYLWSLVTGEDPTVTPESPQLSAVESASIAALDEKSEQVKAVFALAAI